MILSCSFPPAEGEQAAVWRPQQRILPLLISAQPTHTQISNIAYLGVLSWWVCFINSLSSLSLFYSICRNKINVETLFSKQACPCLNKLQPPVFPVASVWQTHPAGGGLMGRRPHRLRHTTASLRIDMNYTSREYQALWMNDLWLLGLHSTFMLILHEYLKKYKRLLRCTL